MPDRVRRLLDHRHDMFVDLLPPDERQAWEYITRNLNMLWAFADQVQAAVNLAAYCDGLIAKTSHPRETMPFLQWQHIAARDGAVSIYNFVQGKQAIHSLAGKSPTIRSYVDEDKKAEAGRLLEEFAPHWGRVRQSVAHAGEHASTPKNHAENSRDLSPTSTMFISGGLSGRRFTATVDKKLVHYDLTQETAAALRAAAQAMDDSFLPLAAFTQQIYREMRQSGRWPPRED